LPALLGGLRARLPSREGSLQPPDAPSGLGCLGFDLSPLNSFEEGADGGRGLGDVLLIRSPAGTGHGSSIVEGGVLGVNGGGSSRFGTGPPPLEMVVVATMRHGRSPR
jgi:hypothetical protein